MLCPNAPKSVKIEAHLRVLQLFGRIGQAPEPLCCLGSGGLIGAPDWNRTSDLWLRRQKTQVLWRSKGVYRTFHNFPIFSVF